VLDALLDALGPEGTLVVPTLSYLFVSPGTQPRFDVRSTPTNLGAIPAAALRRAGPRGRSLHPTHSCVALGPRAQEVVGAHALDASPVGAHSPFARVRELGGQVAFLGCPHGSRCNTSIHGVEKTLEPPPPYLLRPGAVEYVVVDADGAERVVQHRRHDFANTAQRYERVAALMAAADAAGSGRERTHWAGSALGAAVVVLDAKAMWAAARAALEAGRAAGAWPLTEATAEGAEEDHHLVTGKDGSFRYRVGPRAPG
jgi:aminoglycoside N3'-acetyltransferase